MMEKLPNHMTDKYNATFSWKLYGIIGWVKDEQR